MYNDLLNHIKRLADPKKAKAVSNYFQTAEGKYGHGDVFIGLSVPTQRLLAKQYQTLPLKDVDTLLTSAIHEYRLIALFILTFHYQKATQQEQEKLIQYYLRKTKCINNWDLVDSSAPVLLGSYLSTRNKDVLYQLAHSSDLWEKRIAMVATAYFIRKGDVSDAIQIATILLHDSHDLIQKAVGWMLREVGKKDQKALITFLDTHSAVMPRTTLRYALEHFPQQKRQEYMNRKQMKRTAI